MMSTPETPRSPFSHLTPLRRQGQPLPTTLTSNITHAFAFHMMFFMEWHRAVWVLGVQLLSFSSMFGGTRHIAAFKGSLMAVWCIHYHRVSAPDCCRRASAWLPLALLQMVQSRAFYPMHLGVHMCILLLGIGRVHIQLWYIQLSRPRVVYQCACPPTAACGFLVVPSPLPHSVFPAFRLPATPAGVQRHRARFLFASPR